MRSVIAVSAFDTCPTAPTREEAYNHQRHNRAAHGHGETPQVEAGGPHTACRMYDDAAQHSADDAHKDVT
jgi:hypothetical protein